MFRKIISKKQAWNPSKIDVQDKSWTPDEITSESSKKLRQLFLATSLCFYYPSTTHRKFIRLFIPAPIKGQAFELSDILAARSTTNPFIHVILSTQCVITTHQKFIRLFIPASIKEQTFELADILAARSTTNPFIHVIRCTQIF
jgi:hypothetical protein